MKNKNFPDHFLLGTSTSSYQIEGNYEGTGAGSSIWSTFCKQPGAVKNGDHGEIACDHYNRWQQDIALMKELGIRSYRFSLSWPRIIPDGRGKVNAEGLGFYDKLTDGLLEAGIKPFPTLYHWDLPQALQDRGGWAWRGIVDAFAEYTEVVVNQLGDRISDWLTLNEPWVFMHLGHIDGVHAPGIKDMDVAAKVYKNILLTHGKAMQTIKSINPDLRAGHCCNFTEYHPKTEAEADRNAARRYFEYQNMLFTEPWQKGSIPEIVKQLFSENPDSWSREETDLITTPSDLMGFNYYTRYLVSHDEGEFLQAKCDPPPGHVTDMNWAVYPQGLSDMLQWAYERYQLPMYVTENGCAYDYPVESGRVADQHRIHYIDTHLDACQSALENGVDLRGYHYWSFLDNFEWALGYEKRFGMVHVDFDTQKRIIKDSGYHYRDVIAQHNHQLANNTTE